MARRGENIYKRRDGRYEGRYIKYYNASGKAVYGYVYSKSYSETKEKLAQCKILKTNLKPGSEIKLGDWLLSRINSLHTIKSTTKRIYLSHIKNNIIPYVGEVPLKKINRELVQSYLNSIKLSPSTLKTIYTIIKSALEEAEDRGYINKVPNRIKLPCKEKSIVRVLTIGEQKKLESGLCDDAAIGILISLYTGLRIGEVCALKWSDINLEVETLTVNGTQTRTLNGVEITSPKSLSSKREIPLPGIVKESLEKITQKGEFVLNSNGKATDVRTYRRYFKKILTEKGLPDIKYHALRHTFATRALEVGMDYKTLSEILGHSSVGITLDLYAHSLREHKIKQMNKMDNIFNK